MLQGNILKKMKNLNGSLYLLLYLGRGESNYEEVGVPAPSGIW
jgi:hypothetical protein